MPPHRRKYKQGNRIKQRKIPPLFRHLASGPEVSFSIFEVTKPLCHCAGKCVQNGAQPSLGGRANVRGVIRVAILNAKAQRPQCSFLRQSSSPTPLLCRMAPSLSHDGSTQGFGTGPTRFSPTVDGQHLSPPREPIHLSTNTRIVRSSSPRRGEASRNALLYQPPPPLASVLL